ncbi:outer membrane protein assembly factor BamB family protein [Oerskovia paurometabola]|uniref:PQQ-binding-like beta-propeller repeat protein n=1 Tax=Oerskovia paurometabola TaxID=162170 RepID=A0ABW1XB13_9CELL|nr:PQQ-binding-like beta-propeller repeat protein [Oerskovia paurometabola]MBM7497115.1 outer membrane protein assembly factor BamB [Oerskovia paurometabola]
MRTMEFEEEHDGPVGGPPERPDGSGGRLEHDGLDGPGSRTPRRPGLPWIAAGIAVVVVAAGLVVDGTIEDRRETARLVGAFGAVVPWGDAPPGELWSVDAPGGQFAQAGADGVVLIENGTVSGVDLGTGEIAWSRDVGPGATCGTDLSWNGSTQRRDDPLVCVSGGPERLATVLDDDGTVLGSLSLDDVGGAEAFAVPGPSGTVVLAERAAEPAPGATAMPYRLLTIQGTMEDVVVPAGRAARVVAVDVATGEMRWERVVDFVAPEGRPGSCMTSTITDGLDEESFSVDADSLSVLVVDGMVRVLGCGVDSLLSSAGARLRAPGADDWRLFPAGSGGFVSVSDTPETTHALDGDGAVRWETGGHYLFPQAVDGSEQDAWYLANAGRLIAVDAHDGSRRWAADIPAEQVLVQTDERVVVTSSLYRRALDPDTGQTLWETEVTDGDRPSVSTFTDGRRFFEVSMVGDQATDARLTAYDLATGERLWVLDDVPVSETVLAFGGALLRVGETSLSRWG